MPFVPEQPLGLDTSVPTPQMPGVEELGGSARPDVSSVAGAAFREGNVAVNLLHPNRIDPYRKEDGYNTWELIKDKPQYRDRVESFIDVHNTAAHKEIEAKIDKEIEDKKILDAAPWYQSLPLRVLAGGADLPTLLPGGAFIRGGKYGFSVAKSAGVIGAAAGAGSAAQELALQNMQETRSLTESGVNIGASIFLGGLLGAGGAAALTKGQFNRAIKMLNDDIEGTLKNVDRGIGVPGSAGAAAAGPMDIESNTIYGTMAGALAGLTKRLNPGLRTMQSPNPYVREYSAALQEFSPYLNYTREQGPVPGHAAESYRKEWTAGLAESLIEMRTQYTEYRKAGGTMTKTEFQEAVGKAMRFEDADANPQVAKVAKKWRDRVFDPGKEKGQAAGLLPKDVEAVGAQSYLSRMWNVNKLNAKEAEAKQKFMEYFREELEKNFETERAALSAKMTEADQRLRKPMTEADFEKMSEEELKGVLSPSMKEAAEIVVGRRKGTAPPSFASWLVEQGGVKDPTGDVLSALGGSHRTRPGLINKEGLTLDVEVADLIKQKAKGFFPERDIPGGGLPTDRDILRWLEESLAGREPEWWLDAMHPERKAKVETTEAANRMAEQFDRAGIQANSMYDVAKAFRDESIIAGRGITLEDLERLHAGSATNASARTEMAVAAAKAKFMREFEDRWSVGRMGEGVGVGDQAKPNFDQHAMELALDQFAKLTKRTDDGPRPEFTPISLAGPLKEKTFQIPDERVGDFIEHDIELIGRRYSRLMGADVELANKFGSVDMAEPLAKIRAHYEQMRNATDDQKVKDMLNKAEISDINDIKTMRDNFRETIHMGPLEQNYSRIVQGAAQVNYTLKMGEAALASLTESMRPAMVHGLVPFMKILPKFVAQLEGIKMAVAEIRLAGLAYESVLLHRVGAMAEILDPLSRRHPIEAFLDNMTRLASKWNGLALLTDMQQQVAGVMTMDRVLKNVGNYAKLSEKERAYMRHLQIGDNEAEIILKQFEKHGITKDGIRIANTEEWDKDALTQRMRRDFRAALNKDVDSIITTPGIGDVPNFVNTPTGRMIFQFRRFALAANQRVMLRGLQEDQARFLGGIIAMTTMGMGVTYLKALSGNTQMPDIQKNPGWLIGEGIDKASFVPVLMEASNIFEKATGLNPIKTPIRAFDEGSQESQRNINRSLIGTVGGPTVGLIDDMTTVAGIPKQIWQGEDVAQAQKNAAERLMFLNSYVGWRQFYRYFLNPRDQ